MMAFQSARRAVDCAAAIQIALAERNEGAPEPVRVRMGLHAGETIKEGADFFGKNVILAARIASQARGGQVLISSILKALVESGGDLRFGEVREVELKGLAGTNVIHEIIWSDDERGGPPSEVRRAISTIKQAAGRQPDVQYCITEDGVRIAYADHGEGPAVLFIPYFAESFSMQEVVEEELLAFYDRLGAGRRIIRYDGRGTGLSEREVEDFSHEAMLRDLEAVVQALGVREFALWGQTLGGPRAIEFAAGHPEMVTRLILVATFPKGADVMAKDQLDSLAALARTNWEMASQLFADMVGRETSEANARR